MFVVFLISFGPLAHWMNESVSFEEYLLAHGTLTYSNKGVSMLPLLREGQDLFTVSRKGSERCKVGDVVLFRRNGKYILHRVVKVRGDSYDCLGDNATKREFGILDSNILGVMESFTRNGKKYLVSNRGYRVYSVIWIHSFWLRKALKRAAQVLKRRSSAFPFFKHRHSPKQKNADQ